MRTCYRGTTRVSDRRRRRAQASTPIVRVFAAAPKPQLGAAVLLHPLVRRSCASAAVGVRLHIQKVFHETRGPSCSYRVLNGLDQPAVRQNESLMVRHVPVTSRINQVSSTWLGRLNENCHTQQLVSRRRPAARPRRLAADAPPVINTFNSVRSFLHAWNEDA
jgi:hypothetical protein